jgi:hypothetical protein
MRSRRCEQRDNHYDVSEPGEHWRQGRMLIS